MQNHSINYCDLFKLALLVLSISSCSGGGGGSSPGDLTVKSVAGLWDTSHEIDGVTDQFMLAIEENGAIKLYDNQADIHGTGESCYETYATEPGQTIKATGGNEFEVTMDVDNIVLPQILTLSLSDDKNTLTVVSSDTFDEDSDNDFTEEVTESYTRVQDLKAEDLVPVCS